MGRELPGLDSSQPNVARMYDYLLGGRNNFAADRAAADRVLAFLPQQRATAVENRRFLDRAVRFLAAPEQGITQFLDIGAGLPTKDSVHEVARHASPDGHIKVAYVDYDPVVVSHGKAMLAQRDCSIAVQADVRDPVSLVSHPDIRRHLDFSRPVALILVNVLNWLGDDDHPRHILAVLRDALPPGSFLVLTHMSTDLLTAAEMESVRRAAQVFDGASAQLRFRTRTEIMKLFNGWELVEPGLVPKREWRPVPGAPEGQSFDIAWAGVARKRLQNLGPFRTEAAANLAPLRTLACGRTSPGIRMACISEPNLARTTCLARGDCPSGGTEGAWNLTRCRPALSSCACLARTACPSGPGCWLASDGS